MLRRSTGDATLGAANPVGETRWRSFPAIGDCACRASLVGVSHLGEPGVGVADRVATGKRNSSTGGCEHVGKTLTLWRI